MPETTSTTATIRSDVSRLRCQQRRSPKNRSKHSGQGSTTSELRVEALNFGGGSSVSTKAAMLVSSFVLNG